MKNFANIDNLIESYDIQSDPILQKHYKPLEEKLWRKIERYGEDTNDYGEIVSNHLIRTSSIGAAFIEDVLGFSKTAAQNFYDANLLQDLGKTHFSYDEEIWRTPHRPTPEEREKKRAHTQLGVELLDLALTKSPQALLEHPHIQVTQAIQLYHHEHVDGEGYEGLQGDELGQVIKAICIIDAFDGDMIHRPHQPVQRTAEEALERLKNASKYKGAFDPVMLEQFIDFTL